MNRLLYAFVMVVTCAVGFGQFQLVAYGQEADALSKLKKAKENYEKAREVALKKWDKQIDRLIKDPKHGLSGIRGADNITPDLCCLDHKSLWDLHVNSVPKKAQS